MIEFPWQGAAAALLLGMLLASWFGRAGSPQRRAGAWVAGGGRAAAAPPRVPPVVPGLPLLGSALALGSGGAALLRQCREKYGDAFTLRLLGQRMTFVFAPAALRHYFTAPDSQLTFAPAVQQFTHRVFGLPPKHFYSKHVIMLQALRHLLVPSALPQHVARLLQLLLGRLQRWPASGQVDLVREVKGLVFEASVGTLFGPSFLGQPGQQPLKGDGGSRSCSRGATGPSSSSSRAQRLQDAFFTFEEGFELAASPLPHAFQPAFLLARRRLKAALRESYEAGHFEGTVAGSLIEECGLPGHCVPSMLLALLWASQANAVPTAFWSLGLLLLPEHAQHLQEVLAEAQQAAGPATAAANGTAAAMRKAAGAGRHQPAPLTQEQQQGLVALACSRHTQVAAVVAEAMRLRSFSIDVRIAAADGVLPCGDDCGSGSPAAGAGGIWVQKGDVVAISPFESHLDPRLYPDSPAAFKPAREGMQLGGSTSEHAAVVGVGGVPGLSFGGGKYRCPGRYFAEAELALITSLLLLLFDWKLLPREEAAARSRPAPSGGKQPRSAAAAAAAAAAPAGDRHSLLPPSNLRKLVGIKVPAGPCWVQYQWRQPPDN